MAWNNYKSNNKYSNKKIEVDGITFDSKREAKRYGELKLLEKVGAIAELQRQVKYILIPAQYEQKWFPRLKVIGNGKCIERECAYYADFQYIDCKSGETIVEDTKGMRTTEYVIKRKMMLYKHGIRIREV